MWLARTFNTRTFSVISVISVISGRTFNVRSEVSMRMKNKERDAIFAMDVFRDCDYMTVAVMNPDGTPYCVPVSPIVVDDVIYFHGAKIGQKADAISHNPAVCLSAVSFERSVPEMYSVSYRSAVASGKCVVVSDDAEKIKVLQATVEKYAKSNDSQAVFDEHLDEEFAYVCVYKVDIEQITGKESKF